MANANTDSFVTETEGPKGTFGVFEDDGETGYLYLYQPDGLGITRHLHIYDRSPRLNVQQDDVKVLWSDDHSKVGVLIWGKMRGIIDLTSGREGRVWLECPESPGVSDDEWLNGFKLSR
jgi:hypothetical protein